MHIHTCVYTYTHVTSFFWIGVITILNLVRSQGWEWKSREVVLFTFLYGFSLGPLFPGALLVAEDWVFQGLQSLEQHPTQ